MVHDPHDHFCAMLEVRPEGAGELTQLTGRAALWNEKFWGTHRVLTVGFYGGSDPVRQRVVQFASGWTTTSADIRLVFWTGQDVDPANADIRVSFVQDGRSWSYIGKDAWLPELKGQPTMNLGWLTEELPDEEARSVILHEFGHALGLIHEHQNPNKQIDWDKDAVSADLGGPPNNWDPDTIYNNMFKTYDPNAIFGTAVDPDSIMMYPIKASWTKNGFSVGFNSQLSANDEALITTAYKQTGLG
ncbi:M12 family metallopeptidase [Mesorhizobium sp.]|uniref:M12 family metallopeptidase n=1 Tax=Mesorhizobium sp. TaxID=1871066 RepID=UPI0025DC0E9E|nr:M12 family metallopeptidase [Mesorhizobium sp.]